MGITVSTNATILLQNLGIHDSAIKSLKKAGVYIEISLDKVKFVYDGQNLSSFPMTSLMALKLGQEGAKVAENIQLTYMAAEAVQVALMQVGVLPKGEVITPKGKPLLAKMDEAGFWKTGGVVSKKGNHPVTAVDMAQMEGKAMTFAKNYGMGAEKIKELIKKGPPSLNLDEMVKELSPLAMPKPMKYIDEALMQHDTSNMSTPKGIDYSPVDESFMVPKNKKPLKDAKRLYHPVHGTDSSSCYFLMAANKDISLAARLKGQALSVRVEGKLGTCNEALANAGITMSSSGHASIHLQCDDVLLASRCLGVILLALGLDMETKLPKFQKIVGKGV